METVGLGLLGCGVVGSAVVRRLAAGEGPPALLVPRIAVRHPAKERDCHPPAGVVTGDASEVVEDPRVDVVVEMIGGLQPARELVRRSLELGKPVVTANKALLGAYGPELRAQAEAADLPLLFEAAVGGAIPLLRGLAGLLDGDRVVKLEAVLNGTANFVLSHMEATGSPMVQAAAEARRLGYAEADPTRDLDGSDTADKLALLAHYVFGEARRSSDIDRLGIQWLTPADIATAAAEGRRWRLLGTAVAGCAKVEPVPLRAEHPLGRLTGPDNGVLVTAERAGTLMFCGPGAGGDPTASAILADVTTAAHWVRKRRPAAAVVPSASSLTLRA